jgi:hypothetical protein
LVAGSLLLLGLGAGGCGGEPPSAETVRAHIERQAPGARFRRDSRIRLGRLTLGLARGVLRLVEPGDRDAHRVLSSVDRLEVATYEVESLPPLGGLEIPPRLATLLARGGWVPMVKTRDEDGRTWVYYREDDRGSIRNLYIVELDSVELTIIDLAGNLDRIVAEMVADDPDAFLADLGP